MTNDQFKYNVKIYVKEISPSGFDTLSFLCLIVMVFLSAYSLESTKWNENLNTATGLALVGTLLGTALGISSFRKKQLTFLIVAYSLIVLYSFLIGFPSSSHEAQGNGLFFRIVSCGLCAICTWGIRLRMPSCL
jgi:hypothetical protein